LHPQQVVGQPRGDESTVRRVSDTAWIGYKLLVHEACRDLFTPRLPRQESKTLGVELSSIGLVRRSGKYVLHRLLLNVAKANVSDDLEILCYQQKTGNSTDPTVYVRPILIHQRLLYNHVGNICATARTQDS
jgi:hypothetical protein